jgi:hypothetical protein
MRHQPDLAGQSRSVDGAPVTIRTARMRSPFPKVARTLVEAERPVKGIPKRVLS